MKDPIKSRQAVWYDKNTLFMIDQSLLPFEVKIIRTRDYRQTCLAIKSMLIRGAGTIGNVGAFALVQAFLDAPKKNLWTCADRARSEIKAARPTARSLSYAVDRVYEAAKKSKDPKKTALDEAQKIFNEDKEASKKIGRCSNRLIKKNFKILTHCNTGFLAMAGFGTALSIVYQAHKAKKNIFVYVDETRPRGQGALLTAFELSVAKIPHQIIPDHAAAYLMAKGKIDAVIVSADRIAANGDTANKIGTLEKAVVAREFGVPFYVAASLADFDFECKSGENIPIEKRDEEEVLYQSGQDKDGRIKRILTANPGSSALNYAFDVTPAKYISGFVCKRGIFKASDLGNLKIKNRQATSKKNLSLS